MSRIKVLYAEDEIFLGKIVKETLESRGFEVMMVTNGSSVMGAFTSGAPDVCVLDVMLPGRNGYELATDIRATNDDIPIIFLTAKTQTGDLVRGFRTGGNDYIRKPFSMEELIVRIENALRVRRGLRRLVLYRKLSLSAVMFSRRTARCWCIPTHPSREKRNANYPTGRVSS
ncbi:response regulator transcription factor [Puia sp. P3]|uniref:response regulator transcription factor n=1 Tax=Puia sp. P3 TaxID=3423952 RepID=UPI003D669B2C